MIEVTMSGHDFVSYIAAQHITSLVPRKKGQKSEGITVTMVGDVDNYFYVDETAEEVRALVDAELNPPGDFSSGGGQLPINSENELLNYKVTVEPDHDNAGWIILRASCEINGTLIKAKFFSDKVGPDQGNLTGLANALSQEFSEQLVVGMAPQLKALLRKGTK